MYYETEDLSGNKIVVNGNRIYLILKSLKNKTRALGEIDPVKGFIRIKRSRKKHVFEKNNSYGFNYHMINVAQKTTHILLTDESGTYKIPIDAIKTGGIMYFKEKGFERQIFFPLEEIEKYKL